MKVYLGPYRNWIGPYQIADMIFFWVDDYDLSKENRWDHKLHTKLGNWLNDSWVSKFCDWIHEKKKRKVKIQIHNYDTWSLDHTLSLIAFPLLKQLKATNHGSPRIDDEDVPEELRSTSAPPKENEWDTDDNLHKRWDWIMGEIIWAHEQVLDDHSDRNYYDEYMPDEPVEVMSIFKDLDTSEKLTREIGKFNKDKYDEYQSRVNNGLRLFGKYYQNLWD